MLLHTLILDGAVRCAQSDKAASGSARRCKCVDRALQHGAYGFARGRVSSKGALRCDAVGPLVELDRFPKQCFLAAKDCIQACLRKPERSRRSAMEVAS